MREGVGFAPARTVRNGLPRALLFPVRIGETAGGCILRAVVLPPFRVRVWAFVPWNRHQFTLAVRRLRLVAALLWRTLSGTALRSGIGI